jgi:hypothetical protein
MTDNPKINNINGGANYIDKEASELDVPSSLKERTDGISHSLAFRAMVLFQVLAYGSYSVLVHL